MLETSIQKDIRLALAKRKDNLFWRNNVGKVTHYQGGKTCPTCKKPTLGARVYRHPYGLCVGSADLIGMVPVEVDGGRHMPYGLTLAAFIGLEVKTKKTKIIPGSDQDKFRNLVNSRGGHVEVVRSVQDAEDVIDRIRALDPWINR